MPYDEYKQYTQSEYYQALKVSVREIVLSRNLASLMNDTKWLKLQSAIFTLPFPPAYFVKCLTDKESCASEFLEEPSWTGDWGSWWEEGMPEFCNIEWLKIRPRLSKYRGRLIAPEIIDETAEFEALLKKYSIDYEENNGTFTIYGYR